MVVGLTRIFITIALVFSFWGQAQTRAVKAKSLKSQPPQYLLTYAQLKSLGKKARNQYLQEVAKGLSRLDGKPKSKGTFYFFQLIEEAQASGRFRCIGGGIPVPAGASTCGVTEYAGFSCASGEICNPLIFGVKPDGTPICHRTASTAWCYKNTKVGVNTSLDLVYEKIGADEWNKLRSDLTAICQDPTQTSEPDYVVRDACQHIEYQTQVNIRRGLMNESQSLPKAAGNAAGGAGSAGLGADERTDAAPGTSGEGTSALSPSSTPAAPSALLPRDVDWAMEGNRFEKGNVVELAPQPQAGHSVMNPKLSCQLPGGIQGVVTQVSAHEDGSKAPPSTYGIRFPQSVIDEHCPGFQTKDGTLYYSVIPGANNFSVIRPRSPPTAEVLALRNPSAPASTAEKPADGATGVAGGATSAAAKPAAPAPSSLAPATSPRPRARPARPTPESAAIAEDAKAAIGLTPSSTAAPKPGTEGLPVGSVVEIAIPRGQPGAVFNVDYQGRPAVQCDFNSNQHRSRAQGIIVNKGEFDTNEMQNIKYSIVEFSQSDWNRYCTVLDNKNAAAALAEHFRQLGGNYRFVVPENIPGRPNPFGKAVSPVNAELQALADSKGLTLSSELRYRAPTGIDLPDGSEITSSPLPPAPSAEERTPTVEDGASSAISEDSDGNAGSNLRISSKGGSDSAPITAPPPVVVDPGPAAEELVDVIERVQTEAERGPDFDKELCEWLEGKNPVKTQPIGYRVTDADRQLERCEDDKSRIHREGRVHPTPKLEPQIMEKIANSGVNQQAFKNAMAFYQENLGIIKNPRYLTIIDFTKSSREKRFFLINLETGEVTKHYTTNGRNDREQDGYANYFCNNEGSNSTPAGFHLTGGFYRGRHGRSMMLHGQEPGLNDNTCKRAVVVHPQSADKVPGDNARQGGVWRSNGCPVLSRSVYNDVVDKIANGSLFYNYAGENVEPNKCE